jgi:hypothetical protein
MVPGAFDRDQPDIVELIDDGLSSELAVAVAFAAPR